MYTGKLIAGLRALVERARAKRGPEIVVTADNRILTDDAEYTAEMEKEYAFVDGEGVLLRTATITASEAEYANLIFERLESDRRWMEIEEI
jgi:hypothetical protein